MYCVYAQAGQTKGLEGATLTEKAQDFARQFLRLTMYDKIQFFLCKVEAEHFGILTSREWEDEMFLQIDVLLTARKIEQVLLVTSQHVTDEIERLNDENDEGGGGAFFEYYPNMNRTEVRVYAQTIEAHYETTMSEIKLIIQNICRKENPNCPLYQQRLAEKGLEEESDVNTSSKMEAMKRYFKSISKDSYKCGYDNRGTVNAEGIGGGGNLPLDKESAFKLGIVLFDCIPKTWMQPGCARTLRIYWIGCGFGEEILCICQLAKKFSLPLFIHATDIEQACLDIFIDQVVRLKLQAMIKITKVNVYATDTIGESFDIVYTSAAVDTVFILKTLYLALSCSTVQFVLCNHTHCVVFEEKNLSTSAFQDLARNRLPLVDAHLAKDADAKKTNKKNKAKSKAEERWIYALDISRYAVLTKNY